MGTNTLAALATGAGLLVAVAVLASSGVPGRGGTPLESPGLAGQDTVPKLSVQRPEAPQPPAPDANDERCVACRLATRTTGALAPGSFTLAPEMVANGAVLRITSPDPHVRATLWQAMLERSALLTALRSGKAMTLCSSCAARRALISQVEFRAQRTAGGLTLAYASKNPAVVAQLHALVRSVQAEPVPF
jgi:hypothetical protein